MRDGSAHRPGGSLRLRPMSEQVGGEEIRVSTIELFFDLVFVFTITQLTSLLVAEPDVPSVWRRPS